MKKFDGIDSWLGSTIKNEYYFSSENVLKDKQFRADYAEAVKTLFWELDPNWTREGYIAWRKAWRATYSKLSQESLSSKRNRKTTGRSVEVADKNYSNSIFLGAQAYKLLEMREWSKTLADHAYREIKARKLEAA